MNRRSFLQGTVLGSVSIVSAAGAESRGELARWTFDRSDKSAVDEVSGLEDKICAKTGTPEFRNGVGGRALRLDGYTVWSSRRGELAPLINTEFTIELWVALESYPTAAAAFLNQSNGNAAGYFFGLDQFGFVRFELLVNGNWRQCVSMEAIPRFEWVHIAVSLDAPGQMSIYRNGRKAGAADGKGGGLLLARTVDLLIGKTDGCDYGSGVFPTVC